MHERSSVCESQLSALCCVLFVVLGKTGLGKNDRGEATSPLSFLQPLAPGFAILGSPQMAQRS